MIDTLLYRNTISAGGNSGGIPIPLVCSPLTTWQYTERAHYPYLASFVGSETHPIRTDIVKLFANDPEFAIVTKQWSFDVSNHALDAFRTATSASKFTLCPRGYGAQSFRTYEAMQLGSVPIYVHDDNLWLPFNDIVPWHKFAVLVHEKDLPGLKNILADISDEAYSNMLHMGAYMVQNYFNIDSTCKQIHTYLNENHSIN
jgi:hypothetical protein